MINLEKKDIEEKRKRVVNRVINNFDAGQSYKKIAQIIGAD